MDSADYIADLEVETRTLRNRVTELERELRKVRDELRIALERKVEEINDGVPPEELVPQNRPKKEETLGTVVVKHESKEGVGRQIAEPKQPKLARDEVSPILDAGSSTAQPLREPSVARSQGDDDGDLVIVIPPRPSQGKRKGETDQPSPRPTKRQMFWVEVPPRRIPSAPAEVKPPSADEITQGVTTDPAVRHEPGEKMANALAAIRDTSIVKDKKTLDDVSVFTRLSRIGLEIYPITIEQHIKDFATFRVFLSQHFGGRPMRTFPVINEDRIRKHGFDNFVYANMTFHPHAPSRPGAPGIWINCNKSEFSGDEKRLIVRIKTKPQSLWQYMGQYEAQLSDPLSLQEWMMQSEQTKEGWVKYIHLKGWGGKVRARIKFRKLEGREPTEDEEGELEIPGYKEVIPAEIRQAFDKGEERLYTWTLKCRGYDERFQREIWSAGSARVKKEE